MNSKSEMRFLMDILREREFVEKVMMSLRIDRQVSRCYSPLNSMISSTNDIVKKRCLSINLMN